MRRKQIWFFLLSVAPDRILKFRFQIYDLDSYWNCGLAVRIFCRLSDFPFYYHLPETLVEE